jgi:hypothetical protein
VKIRAESSGGALIADIDIVQANILQGAEFVRKLAARKKIQELQESTSTNEQGYEEEEANEVVKKAITRLGIDNGLASKYTSFVGIDKNTGQTLADKPMSTREIKNQVPSGSGMSCRPRNRKGAYRFSSTASAYDCSASVSMSACLSKGKIGSHVS